MTTPQGQPGDPYPGQQGWGSQQGNPPYPAEPPPGAPVGKPRRPGVIVGAVVLWVLTGLFTVLAGLVTAFAVSVPGLEEQIEDALAQSGVQTDAGAVQQAIVVTGVVVAIVGALIVLLALLMLAGSNAARVVLTVLGVVLALLLLGTVVGTLVVLVAIVLQFLPPANKWFRARRAAR